MKRRPFYFSLITSALFMTFCSMASFLFPIHSRADQNIFYTLGRGIIDGRVPYRDLFEHKGPLIYFFHAFGAMVDRHSFIGLYILEILFFAVTLLFLFKTARLFTSEKAAYIAALLTGSVCCTSFCFKYGDNAEEYCFALLTVSLYYLLRYCKAADPFWKAGTARSEQAAVCIRLINYKVIFINGILAGCVLWIKFTQLGFWMAWMGLIFFALLLQKDYKRAFISCLVYLGGMAATAVPWIVYFGINEAISDWLTVYFYDNIVLYAKSVSLWSKLATVGSSFIKDIGQNPLAMFLILLGLVRFGLQKAHFTSRFARLSVWLSFLTLYVMLYIGGVRYDYYMLIAVPFTLLGGLAFLDAVRRIPWSLGICLLLCTLYVAAASNVLPYYGKPKSSYPQYKFAEIINQKGEATLLNYGFLDQGFYLAAGIEPIEGNRFFSKVNISEDVFPEMYEEQIGMAAHQKVDFMVIRTGKDQTIEHDMRLAYDDLFQNYRIIAAADDPFENYRFFLLEKIRADG